MASDSGNRSPSLAFNQTSPSVLGSLSRPDRSSSPNEFIPPSLPPRRNPPPPPPRSGSGLYAPPPPSSQQPPQNQHHHDQCVSSDQRRHSTSVVAAHQRFSRSQRVLVQPPEVVSDSVDVGVANGLLRLLFSRFGDTTASPVSTNAGDAVAEGGPPDLRRVVAHLVRIAHAEIYIEPMSTQTSEQCLDTPVASCGGVLEKIEMPICGPAPSSTLHIHSGKTFIVDANMVTSVRKNGKGSNLDIQTTSVSSSSSSSVSSDSASSSDEDDKEAYIGADYGIYEGDEADGTPCPTSTPFSFPITVTNMSNPQQTNSTTLLTVAELHELPKNTTVKGLKASAMQALIALVSAYHLDPALRQRDLDIVQLLARIQLYTMAQSERVVAARSVTCAAAAGRLSPDDGRQCIAPTHVPVPEVAALVRLSFHPNHRQAICDLGGLHALLGLLHWEHSWWQLQGEHNHTISLTDSRIPAQVHSTTPPTNAAPLGVRSASSAAAGVESCLEASLALRRYICVSLTNLTFGAPDNKFFVCKRRSPLDAVIAQLEVGSEELKQVAASVLRNLSWHTDARSKAALRRAQAATRLTRAVLSAQREATLRTTLNALWNLSSHSTANRKAVCSVNGALAFLVFVLDAKNPNKDVEIKANSGGVLRNLCPVIVNSLEYRAVLRTHNCLSILLDQLRTSPSVTVVVNVCEILGALSAAPLRGAKPSFTLLLESVSTDQALMIRLGALDILHRLAHSHHRYVVSSSKQALENLERAHVLLKNQRVVPYPANFENPTFNPSTTTTSAATSNQSSPGSRSPSSPAEQVYRRRMNNRPHLRFGLLSVVLETNDGFDEEEESEDEEEEADDVESVPEEKRSIGCSSKVSEVGGEEEADFKLPGYPPVLDDRHADLLMDKPPTPPPPPIRNQASVGEEEQACVYAEEGTPFGPSTRASTLDLRSPPKHEASSPVYGNFVFSQRRSVHPYVNFDMSAQGSSVKQASSPVSSPGFETSSNDAVLETPLMFSRASSSCISSVDFGPLPPIESSPESVYSVALDDDDDDPNEAIALGTSPSDLPPSLINDIKKSKAINNDEKMGVVEEETQIMFAEEGSPLDASSLCGDRDSMLAVPPMWSVPESAIDSVQSSHNILQQCIASVMPAAASAIRQIIDYPVGDVGTEASPTDDTIQSFAVEGTPFAFSTKNSSLSDVSIADPNGVCEGTSTSLEISKSASPRQSILKDGAYICSTEDASSVNEVEEEGEVSVNLLSEVIQSALPKHSGFSTARGQSGTVYTDVINNMSSAKLDEVAGESKLVTPRIGFGHPVQQRRPQATVAPMPQRNVEERQTPSTNESVKADGKQNGCSDGENSSFSSLLSIESVGIETSLLQECISSAMPTPKLPISSSCRGIGGSKATKPQQPTVCSVPPPSASVPTTTLVLSHSSQSPSPLAVSEVTTNSRQWQNLQQNKTMLQPRRQQTASNCGSGGQSGLRRTGHFLARGSGTADAHTSRPETILTQISNPSTNNATNRLAQIGKLSNPKTVTKSASVHGSPAVQALRAPRLISGIALPGSTKAAPPAVVAVSTPATPTAVLRPFGLSEKRNDNLNFFPLSTSSANLDVDDDSVTLVGESSPAWRPSPPSTPSLQDAAINENKDDELLDLDTLMDQSNNSLDLLRGSPKRMETLPATNPTIPLCIKPSPAGRLLAPTTVLRRPSTVRSTLSSSTSSSISASSQRLLGTGIRSATLAPSLPPQAVSQAPRNTTSKALPSTSKSRLLTQSSRNSSTEGQHLLVTRPTATVASGLTSPLRYTTTSAATVAVTARGPLRSDGIGRTIRSTPLNGLKPSFTTVTTTPPVTAASKKVIRTGVLSEALVKEKQQQLAKGVRGSRKVSATTVPKSRVSGIHDLHYAFTDKSVNQSAHSTPTSVVRPKYGLNVTPLLSQTSLVPPTPQTVQFAMSGLKPPGFSSLAPTGLRLRPPRTPSSKTTTSINTSLTGLQATDQWIVRRELTG